MTKTCCMECKTPSEKCPNPPTCRTDLHVSWCKGKPKEQHPDAEWGKTNKDICLGDCDKFT